MKLTHQDDNIIWSMIIVLDQTARTIKNPNIDTDEKQKWISRAMSDLSKLLVRIVMASTYED